MPPTARCSAPRRRTPTATCGAPLTRPLPLSTAVSRKNKTRLARNLRPDALQSTVPAEFDVVEEPEFDVVRTKRFAVKPMTTEEAILQMNLLDHTFYVFRNMDTSAVCVVYRRNNGGYGLIETQD